MKLLFRRKADNNESVKSPSDSANNEKKRLKLSGRHIKIIAVVLVIAIVAGCFAGYRMFFKNENKSGGEITALAQIGTVSSVIEGSGTLQALQQYEITSLKKGEVVADYFEEGDTVSKDDILYRMDDKDGYDAIENTRDSVESQQSNVQKSQNSLVNAADAIDTAKDSVVDAQRKLGEARVDLENLNVKSGVSGVISNIYISKGDNISANAKIADVYDSSKMILDIQFLSDYVSAMTQGVSSAAVTLSQNGTVVYGTVTKISSGSITNSVGASVRNVEITVDNPGAIDKGDYATALVGEYACSSEGTFRYFDESSIISEVSGKVEKMNIMLGDKVEVGEVVAVLSNDALRDSVNTASDSVAEANKNLTSRERSYKEATQSVSDAQRNLSNAKEDYSEALESLDDYLVKAPIDGTIIQKNIKAGENLETSNSATVMAIIADLSSIVFEMSVDELDISKLEEGMDVEVSADAIANVTFSAKITNISIVGTSNNGVTTYPVKIALNPKEEQRGSAYENYDKLIPGMNVSASVVIERVEDVVVLPVSAVRRGNIVIVDEESSSVGVSFPEFTPPSGFNGAKPSVSSDGNMPKFERNAPSDGNMPKFERKASSSGDEKSERYDGERKFVPQNPSFGAKTEKDAQKGNGDSKQNNTMPSSQNNDRLKSMMESLEIPEGYKAIVVETGLSDENFIEIKNGLSVGDKVLLPDTTQSAGRMPAQGMMPGGMPGGMGGGMPGGMRGAMPGGMNGGMRGGMGAGANRPAGGGAMR